MAVPIAVATALEGSKRRVRWPAVGAARLPISRVGAKLRVAPGRARREAAEKPAARAAVRKVKARIATRKAKAAAPLALAALGAGLGAHGTLDRLISYRPFGVEPSAFAAAGMLVATVLTHQYGKPSTARGLAAATLGFTGASLVRSIMTTKQAARAPAGEEQTRPGRQGGMPEAYAGTK